MKRVGIICGGSGSSKFATAFSKYADSELDLGFIANVADNYWYHGLYVCPDVDIITHALAEKLDTSKGWGVASDTLTGKKVLSELSQSSEWFTLGDSDAALCLRRTELMKKGWSLSAITEYLRNSLQIRHPIIPATDDPVMTFIKTAVGLMHLQQYWVKYKAEPEATAIEYVGLKKAKPNPSAISYLSNYTIICPANPVTSVMPTISMKLIEKALKKSRVVAISPFVGDKPFSGPAARMISAIGIEPSSFGVAKLYSTFLKLFLVDTKEDSKSVTKIKDLGIECIRTNTTINENSRQSVAMEIMSSL
ncbi:MAG TPA: 2-phospho-L-lactate transferase [Nitrososphaerales archaeon]|nr:2-phospho-L-lactate transferase [Nitrososphaerales archaeon]